MVLCATILFWLMVSTASGKFVRSTNTQTHTTPNAQTKKKVEQRKERKIERKREK